MVTPDPAAIGPMKGSEEMIEVDPARARRAAKRIPGGKSTRIGRSFARRQHGQIARPGDALSPSRRHIEANSSLGPLTNVQIDVIDAEESMSAPGMSNRRPDADGRSARGRLRQRAAGQADIGKHGRLQPVRSDFPMPAGSDAKIRAYGNGDHFVEASVDTVGGGSGMTEYRNPPMYPSPYGAYPPSYYPPDPYAYANPNPYAPGYNPYAPNPYPYGYPRATARRRPARHRRRSRGTASCSTSARDEFRHATRSRFCGLSHRTKCRPRLSWC